MKFHNAIFKIRLLFLLTIILGLHGCTNTDDDTTIQEVATEEPLPEDTPPVMANNLLFVIAGQSNAEGNVFLEGLSLLQGAIPENSEQLTQDERRIAREAVAQSLGVFCEVEPPCIENPESCPNNPFSFTTADAVIDGLQTSTIDWRSITTTYQHPSVRLITHNFRNEWVEIIDENGEEIDNEDCIASPDNTSLNGPFLDKYTSGVVVPLATGYGAETDDGSISYGTELGFGMKIADAVINPVIVKVTMGGSSLHDHWRSSGTLYQTLIDETNNALQETGATLGGFIWFQGFNDQFEDAYCQPLPNLYEENLTRLVTDVRTDLNAPELPIIIVEARDEGELSIIQDAQNAVAMSDNKIALVVSKDFSDCFHYGSGSQIIIGERIGKVMTNLITE